MRLLYLVSLLLLVAISACGHQSPLEPPWPPDPPVYREPPQVDQEIVDRILDKILCFEGYICELDFPPDEIWGGLEEVYAQSVADGEHVAAKVALYVMGQAGMIEFLPTLVSALDVYPSTACGSLSFMPSDYAVYAVIPYLDSEDRMLREDAANSLGRFRYYSQFPGARYYALAALEDRLCIEKEEWLHSEIIDNIVIILSGMQE